MNLDRIKAGLAAFIDAHIGRRVTYHGLYPSTVVNQAADGRVDVLPDDEAVRGAGIGLAELRNGAPGYEYDVPAGARCLVGFEAGDPSRPYVAGWMPETGVTRLTFDSGTKSIARVDDVTDVGTLQIVGVLATGTITWTYVSPTGVPSVFPVAGAIPLTADFTVGPISLSGLITTGNDKLKA